MPFHKLSVIGRLVSDPRLQPFSNGGGVAKFGIPIDFTRRKKNQETGVWEGPSFIIDVDAFNHDNGMKLADLVMQYLKKGSQVYIEGRLKPNEYTDKNGVKVFKPVLVADTIQFLDRPTEGGGGDNMRSNAPRMASNAGTAARKPTPAPAYNDDGYNEPESMEPQGGPSDSEIPF